MRGRILLIPDDGGEAVDISTGVQALYDLVIGSMDWGSGFWTVDDATPVVHVAKTCGFEKYEEAEKYVNEQRHSEEQHRFIEQRRRAQQQYQIAVDRKVLDVEVDAGTPGVYVTRSDGRAFRSHVVETPLPHDHVWSSVGRCMWVGCNVLEGEA